MVDVVSSTWLADRLDGMRMVDACGDWEFDDVEHLPGAVSIPLDEFRSADDDVGMLPSRDVWTGLLSGAGAAADDDMVVYSDTYSIFATRFPVAALLCGHGPDRFHLLSDNFSAWSRERETTTEAGEVAGMVYEIIESAKAPLVDFRAVEAALSNPETTIVGTHDPAECNEGYLSGAVNLDWCGLVDGEMHGLKLRDEFGATLDAMGVIPDRWVVLYCNTT